MSTLGSIGTQGVRLSARARHELSAARERRAPREACGVLLGRTLDPALLGEHGAAWRSRVVDLAVELENGARDPERFELDPGAIVAAHESARTRGLELLGFWHTHVDAPARPSRSDVHATWPRHLLAIASAREIAVWERDDARGWIELAREAARRCA